MQLILISLIKCFIYGTTLGFMSFIWNETLFVLEYAHSFNLGKYFWYDEFWTYVSEGNPPSYPTFLREKKPCFASKMLGCPFCFIGFFSLPILTNVIWGWGVVASIAALEFLIFEVLYKFSFKIK